MSKKILISGLGGSLFPYLHHKLIKAGYKPFYLDANPVLKFVYPDLNFHLAPFVSDSSYRKFVVDLIKKEGIDIYVPLIDEEIITAITIGKANKSLVVLAPDERFTKLCLDKFSLMKALHDLNISSNPTYMGNAFNWQIPPPVFVKPNIGRGSRGIRKINNKKQLNAYYVLEDYKSSEIIIQPFIKGIEYTVSVLVNSKNKIISISPKRVISKRGITISAVTESNSVIENLAAKITDKLKPKGPFNIQLFLTEENVPVIFEINPRFSTTLVLSYEAGLEEISLLVKEYNSENVRPKKAQEGVHIFRHWENSFYRS